MRNLVIRRKLHYRLMQLGETPIDDPAQWEQDSGLGKLQPSRYSPSEAPSKEHWNLKG